MNDNFFDMQQSPYYSLILFHCLTRLSEVRSYILFFVYPSGHFVISSYKHPSIHIRTHLNGSIFYSSLITTFTQQLINRIVRAPLLNDIVTTITTATTTTTTKWSLFQLIMCMCYPMRHHFIR